MRIYFLQLLIFLGFTQNLCGGSLDFYDGIYDFQAPVVMSKDSDPSPEPPLGTLIYELSTDKLFIWGDSGNGTGEWKSTSTADSITIDGGSYTPVMSDESGVSSKSMYDVHWMRIKDTVNVCGSLIVENNTTGFHFNISLPVASAFNSLGDCGGHISNHITVSGSQGIIGTDMVNNKCQFAMYSSGQNSTRYGFCFSYVVK